MGVESEESRTEESSGYGHGSSVLAILGGLELDRQILRIIPKDKHGPVRNRIKSEQMRLAKIRERRRISRRE